MTLLVRWSAALYILHLLLQGKIALSELAAFWSIFFLAWAIARGEARFSWHIIDYPLVVFGIVSTVSALLAPRRLHAFGEGMLWFKMLIFPAAVILYRLVPRLREWALYAYGLFGAGIACWGLFEFVFLDQRDLDHRITGPSTHVMTFSGLLLPISLMFLFLWWRERRAWQLVVTLVTTFTLLLTFTRSVWLGWGVAVFTVLILMRSKLVLYAVPAMVIFVALLPMPLFTRLVSTFDVRQSSNFDRIRMIEAGVEMIRDHPLLGVGPANVKEMYALYRKQDAPRARPPHLHNNVVQLWAERGILGLAAYILLLGLFLRECASAWEGPNHMWAQIGVAIAVSLTIAGLFEFNFGDTEVFYLTLDLFALVVTAIEQPEARSNEVMGVLVPA